MGPAPEDGKKTFPCPKCGQKMEMGPPGSETHCPRCGVAISFVDHSGNLPQQAARSISPPVHRPPANITEVTPTGASRALLSMAKQSVPLVSDDDVKHEVQRLTTAWGTESLFSNSDLDVLGETLLRNLRRISLAAR
jgi:hypothetical protein